MTAQEVAVAHSMRFRKVSNRYPRRVAEAYEGDLAAAFRASEEVAATVAAWEATNALSVRDWRSIGMAEGRAEDVAALMPPLTDEQCTQVAALLGLVEKEEDR